MSIVNPHRWEISSVRSGMSRLTLVQAGYAAPYGA